MAFSNRVIAITGAASGIGQDVARRLAAKGCRLSIADTARENLDKFAADLRRTYGEDRFVHRTVDVTSRAQVDAWIDDTVRAFGSLDGAVNTAGVHAKESGKKPIWEVSDEDWAFVQAVNVTGMLNCVRAQMAAMVENINGGKAKTGSIVVFGSNSSAVGQANLSAYTTSKHAAIGLMRAAAMDGAPLNVRVNAVCPGPVETPMLNNALPEGSELRDTIRENVPLKRFGRPEEISGLVEYLLSDEGSFSVGGVYMLDGGLTVA